MYMKGLFGPKLDISLLNVSLILFTLMKPVISSKSIVAPAHQDLMTKSQVCSYWPSKYAEKL